MVCVSNDWRHKAAIMASGVNEICQWTRATTVRVIKAMYCITHARCSTLVILVFSWSGPVPLNLMSCFV